MSFLRHDLTTNDWVIFAPERVQRTQEWKPNTGITPTPNSAAMCPFCPCQKP